MSPAWQLATANLEGNGSEFIQALSDGLLNTDLNARYIQHKAATYLCPAMDDGIDYIYSRDLLVVDRSIKPQSGRVIIVAMEGRYCLRRLIKNQGQLLLVDDKGYVLPYPVTELEAYAGTVTASIHEHV